MTVVPGPSSLRMPIGVMAIVLDGAAGNSIPSMVSGSVQLFRGSEIHDIYGFGTLVSDTDTLGNPLFETTPGPPMVSGQSAQRMPDGVDTDDNSQDWYMVELGSPGMPNGNP